jgi:hypothetical protein
MGLRDRESFGAAQAEQLGHFIPAAEVEAKVDGIVQEVIGRAVYIVSEAQAHAAFACPSTQAT